MEETHVKVKKGIDEYMHINTWKQCIIITGGLIMLFMYKHMWRYFGRKYITDTESVLVIFFGSALLIYTSESAMNSKVVTARIF